MSSPAARDVAVNEAIVKIEATVDIVGIESAHILFKTYLIYND